MSLLCILLSAYESIPATSIPCIVFPHCISRDNHLFPFIFSSTFALSPLRSSSMSFKKAAVLAPVCFFLGKHRPHSRGIIHHSHHQPLGVLFVCFTVDQRILYGTLTEETIEDGFQFYTTFFNAPPAIKVRKRILNSPGNPTVQHISRRLSMVSWVSVLLGW
jgi:hypothetical protein